MPVGARAAFAPVKEAKDTFAPLIDHLAERYRAGDVKDVEKLCAEFDDTGTLLDWVRRGARGQCANLS